MTQSKRYPDSKIQVDSWKGMEKALERYPGYPWREYIMSHRDSLQPNRFQEIYVEEIEDSAPPTTIELRVPFVATVLFYIGIFSGLGLVVSLLWNFFTK